MNATIPTDVSPVEAPRQFNIPQLTISLVEADSLVAAAEARQHFGVTGQGLSVAVVDTGLNAKHVDFLGHVPDQRNFTADNSGAPDDASDGNGHGTNVAGIVVANGDHTGIAPGANVIPLKALSNSGGGSFDAVADALEWVSNNHRQHCITAVCMSLGDSGNYSDDSAFVAHRVARLIGDLRNLNIAVCVAAGNGFFTHMSTQGMAFPGILSECVSVGAVYDNFEGPFAYGGGARTQASGPDRITPFSQRLHETVNDRCRTDLFAPGAPITSAGINGPHGESIQHGTSQATPVTTGVILLMQELFLRETGRLPSVNRLVECMRRSGVRITDGDDELDNVTNTGLKFIRLTAVGALGVIRRDLVKGLCETGTALR